MPTCTASSLINKLCSPAAASAPKAVAWSHFNEPIDTTPGRIFGRSRRWGDIDTNSRLQVIDQLLSEAQARKLPNSDTALLLSIARIESGFNPDAASRTSSASGLGQFINRTGQALGLTSETRFSLKDNISAMFSYFSESLRYARRDVRGTAEDYEPYIYAHYHDGPKLGAEGLALSNAQVIPWRDRFAAILNSNPPAPAEEINDALDEGIERH